MVIEDWPSDALGESVNLLSLANGLDAVTFLDVGAHKGETFSFFASHPQIGRFAYHGFEPNPMVYGSLEDLVSKSGVSGSARVHNYAVGANTEPVQFNVMAESAVSGVLDAEEVLMDRVPSGDHITRKVVQMGLMQV